MSNVILYYGVPTFQIHEIFRVYNELIYRVLYFINVVYYLYLRVSNSHINSKT